MKRLLTFVLLFVATNSWATQFSLTSPDGRLSVEVNVDDLGVRYSLREGGDLILSDSKLSLTLYDGEVLGGSGAKLLKNRRRTVNNVLPSPFYIKSEVEEHFNELSLSFKGDYSVLFRAYDEGVAYRFVLNRRGFVTIKDEQVEYNISGDPMTYIGYTASKSKKFNEQVRSSHECLYVTAPLSEQTTEHLALTPMGIDVGKGRKIIITESDLQDYPGIYLYSREGGFSSYFAVRPNTIKQGGYKNVQSVVVDSFDYIAKVEGKRMLPWRMVAFAEQDSELLTNDLVYLLAEPSRIADTSWIEPGMVAWEWWHHLNITGVDFKVGINNDTYKHYIDFAAEYGVRYIILDEGWSDTGSGDLMKVIPEIDIKELVEYGDTKGVGVILWCGQYGGSNNSEAVVKYYADLGVKGFKIDFLSRDDQQMVEFVGDFAELCSRHKMLVDFHGVHKPAGFTRTYPNIVNFEGVAGLEYMKMRSEEEMDMVSHDLDIPFLRMMSGPIDYTQGAMKNCVKGEFLKSFNNPMSQGTRARQAAMYAIYFSPLCMLCDSPSTYRMEPEFTKVITSMPVVWDESVALPSAIGESVAVARRKEDVWYVGAMNGWEPHTFEVVLDFVSEGRYSVELVCDGVNADRVATDYAIKRKELSKGETLKVECTSGGGFLAKIIPLK
ncbi:MAG: glycoside hydrolase family 97 protein [Rikenellaceae bacterium]